MSNTNIIKVKRANCATSIYALHTQSEEQSDEKNFVPGSPSIIIHFPYITAVWLVLKLVWVLVTKDLLFAVLLKPF
jgi:hypothetical protein